MEGEEEVKNDVEESPFDALKLSYEGMTHDRREEVIDIHKELFPVVFEDAFYDQLFGDEMITVLMIKDGAVIGVATTWLKETSNLVWCGSHKVGYLCTFGILDRYRRNKLGTILLSETITRLQNLSYKELSLHVKADNEAAIRFYIREGFIPNQLIRGYYYINGCYEDAYSMSRSLVPPSNSVFASLIESLLKWSPFVSKQRELLIT
eukprot:TRINITY_DN6468_c0_g1_i9.p1 TRINITY_DN6468_c0_g1~~TRINITY_DN6468_c0_g1_i9.p1  ORF type:complete len:207 (+),score=41.80 TRINITY_DN6468_c0_g1_i9:330-950(+)